MEQNALDLALGTGPVVKLVLMILILASVFSWAIIFTKWISFKQVRKETDRFLDLFWNAKSLDGIFSETKHFTVSPVSGLFRAGFSEFKKVTEKTTETGASNATIAGPGMENVERALRKAYVAESMKLEKYNPYLATIASVAPFIGLFGTVWGIMGSFHGLGQGGPATLARVAPGISEALIATAVGLAAAIPALVAYNQYTLKVKGFKADMESFGSDFTNILKRNYLS